ncbi:hypothetical protein [Amycolatopsis magusensis]|uniref:hypothetical protein n=1 Tax=Amycolatopsis magusensis TaxID=882444 RepID=UPI0024A925FB|nr:hypothetical protein [Amycolatopsis magusensis]MDI5982136.1 hypothetical protein [Amycolatopsis magusensis]
MSLPDYWLHRPVVPTTAALREQFDELLDGALAGGPDRPIDYRVDAPKWQFLCHAADRADFVLHGSGDPGITEFVPRRPPDLTDFGSRLAVFAAADGIWPMFYALLDRTGTPVHHVRVGARHGRDPIGPGGEPGTRAAGRQAHRPSGGLPFPARRPRPSRRGAARQGRR